MQTGIGGYNRQLNWAVARLPTRQLVQIELQISRLQHHLIDSPDSRRLLHKRDKNIQLLLTKSLEPDFRR